MRRVRNAAKPRLGAARQPQRHHGQESCQWRKAANDRPAHPTHPARNREERGRRRQRPTRRRSRGGRGGIIPLRNPTPASARRPLAPRRRTMPPHRGNQHHEAQQKRTEKGDKTRQRPHQWPFWRREGSGAAMQGRAREGGGAGDGERQRRGRGPGRQQRRNVRADGRGAPARRAS